jgi:uncharacterized protein
LKPSRYNYFVERDGVILGYNFLYRTIIQFPKEASDLVDLMSETSSADGAHPAHQWPDAWRRPLTETGFLIDRNIDELGLLRVKYYRSLYDNTLLSLVILPTLWCNLTCPYCFELKRAVFMKPAVQDALMRWVERRFPHKRQVHIAWFGGEPLLAKNVIADLTARLKDFCGAIGANYSATLTTNGFYFDKEFQASLEELRIQNVQITFDGDKTQHDQLRTQRNGSGSFERIFSNVVDFCQSDSPARLSIRVNVGDSNYAGIPALLERFPMSVRKRTTIFFRWIWANEASGFQEFAQESQGQAPFQGLAHLYALARKLGWQTRNPHNDLTDGYCEVDYLDHYSIAPDGNVFLCTHTFSPKEALGSLLDENQLQTKSALTEYASWYAASPWNDEKCLACKILPVCRGGCRKSRVAGHRPCIEESTSLDVYALDTIDEQLVRLKGERANV